MGKISMRPGKPCKTISPLSPPKAPISSPGRVVTGSCSINRISSLLRSNKWSAESIKQTGGLNCALGATHLSVYLCHSESRSQRIRNHRLDRANNRHLHSTSNPRAPGHQRLRCPNRKVRQQADQRGGNDSRDTLHEEERNDGNKGADSRRNGRRDRRDPRIGKA